VNPFGLPILVGGVAATCSAVAIALERTGPSYICAFVLGMLGLGAVVCGWYMMFPPKEQPDDDDPGDASPSVRCMDYKAPVWIDVCTETESADDLDLSKLDGIEPTEEGRD
jgi:hypothetical protein